jgi:transposase
VSVPEIKDWQERTWRHLDTCQFNTIVTARVPRLLLKNGKSITVSVPWAQRSARVTRALESHAFGALLNCRSVRDASRLAGLGEDQLDGIMARAVRDCLARRATPTPTHLRIGEPELQRDRLPQAARRASAANH